MKNVVLSKGHLTKSTANPEPVVLRGQPKAHAASAPKSPPQATAKQGNSEGKGTVILTEGRAKGRDSSSSSFTAPRKGESSNPAECGYTKP